MHRVWKKILVIFAIVTATQAAARATYWDNMQVSSSTNVNHTGTKDPSFHPIWERCAWNWQCDFGYICDRICKVGCANDKDCISDHRCLRNRCLTKKFEPCRAYKAGCEHDDDCCSGKCKRRWLIWNKTCRHYVVPKARDPVKKS